MLCGVGFLIFIFEYVLVMVVFVGVMSLIFIFGMIIFMLLVVLIGFSILWGIVLGVVLWIGGVHVLEVNFVSFWVLLCYVKVYLVLVILVLIVGEVGFGIVGVLLVVFVLSLV